MTVQECERPGLETQVWLNWNVKGLAFWHKSDCTGMWKGLTLEINLTILECESLVFIHMFNYWNVKSGHFTQVWLNWNVNSLFFIHRFDCTRMWTFPSLYKGLTVLECKQFGCYTQIWLYSNVISLVIMQRFNCTAMWKVWSLYTGLMVIEWEKIKIYLVMRRNKNLFDTLQLPSQSLN